MEQFRAAVVAFCRWRVLRNGMASGRWLNFSDWIVNGDHPEDIEIIPPFRINVAATDVDEKNVRMRAALSQIRQVAENDGLSHWVEFCDAALMPNKRAGG